MASSRCNNQIQMTDFDFVLTLVRDEDDTDLWRVPHVKEVRLMVFSIDLNGALRPNDFLGKFYQACWDHWS